MTETYRDQWEAAAAVIRSHAAEFDKLAKAAPSRPTPPDAQFLGWMCDTGRGHKQQSWSSHTVYERAYCDACFKIYRSALIDGQADG